MANKPRKTKQIAEFGDFQTPAPLAFAATNLLLQLGIAPRSVIEPTCGKGTFVAAAARYFPQAETIIGIDVNHSYVSSAKATATSANVTLLQGDFFKLHWPDIIKKDQMPWLIIGNPPWVTSAELGALQSENLPAKSNFQGRAGIDAITGKSNFDISEWMLIKYIEWLKGSAGTIAVLCKTAVARKVLLQAWKTATPVKAARIFKIDAMAHFGAAVDACFFVLQLDPGSNSQICEIYTNLESEEPSSTLGFLDGHVIADLKLFNKTKQLLGPEYHYVWRSGVKHDCSKIMELTPHGNGYENGLHETILLEDFFLYPMLKSSDIGNSRIHCRNVMLVTQQNVGEDTAKIRHRAPKTWNYLQSHCELLNRRASSIYKNKPAFSIFGVGNYTFSPWKIAISGFYKGLNFVKVGPVDGRPVVFDDTVYFLPCQSEEEASFLEALLTSAEAKEFFYSMVHWDEKRPITVEILKRLSIRKLASKLDRESDYLSFTAPSDLPLIAAAKINDCPKITKTAA